MEITSIQQFDEIIQNEAVIIDFFSLNCPPCRLLLPIFTKLAEEYTGKVAMYKVDIDKLPELATRYDIFSIPTLVFLKNGAELSKTVGYKDEETLRKLITDFYGV